jgi:hypothetical protein
MQQAVKCLFERQKMRKIDAARKTKEEEDSLPSQAEQFESL